MTHRAGLMRVGVFKRWQGFALAVIVLIGLISVFSYMASLSKNSQSDRETKNVYSSVKSFGAAYTVSRTYTSRSNIVINNLWRQTEFISGGYYYACAVSNGRAYCWGDGANGKLGNSSTLQQLSPVAVTTESGVLTGKVVSSISTGSNHTCAVANGQAFCWGYNGNGRLGDGGTTESSKPVAVTQAAGLLSGKIVTGITTGGDHTCAVANGQAFCWGHGNFGKLGNNSGSSSTTPVAVTQAAGVLAGKTVTSISAGNEHTCVIASGQAFCWGVGTDGKLGNGGVANSTTPVAVTQAAGVLAGKTVTSIGAGSSHTCAVADGQAYCWGNGGSGRLGNNGTTSSSVPVAVDVSATTLAGKTITSISTGSEHTCFVANSKAFCWGSGMAGRLGNGTTNNSLVPAEVVVTGVFSGKNVSNITAATHNSCAIANGRAYCWGWNNSGQLGEGTTVLQKLAPQRVNDSYY